jgi:hypothetical protein
VFARLATAKQVGSWLFASSLLLGPAAAAADLRDPALASDRDSVREFTRESDWQLARTDAKAGIDYALYQRDVPGSGYDRYRLEAVFDAPIDEVIEALQVKHSDDRYLAKGVQRTILEWEPGHSLSYLRMDVPIVADRDVALRYRRGFDAERGVFRDEWSTANDAAPPVEKGVVRIARSEGFWELAPESDSHTHVVYESFADPGGHAPAWLVSAVVDEKLIAELVTLRRIVDRGLPMISAPPPDAE